MERPNEHRILGPSAPLASAWDALRRLPMSDPWLWLVRPGAIEAYGRLADLGLDLVEDGGTYVQSSCSSRVSTDEFRAAVRGAAARSGRRVTVIGETAHAADHPIGFAQGAYLKSLFLTVGAR